MGELAETVLHTLDGDHCLMPFVDGQRLVFYGFHRHFHLRQRLDLRQCGVVGRHCLSLYGKDF